jgi:hypothetical protein
MWNNSCHAGADVVTLHQGYMALKDAPDISDRVERARPKHSGRNPDFPRPRPRVLTFSGVRTTPNEHFRAHQ